MVIYKETGIPFVIIVDEWDCVIRNSKEEDLVHKYLQFLHSLFKSEESKSFLALAYITGILPIKKIKDESALNNFTEFTMIDSYPITSSLSNAVILGIYLVFTPYRNIAPIPHNTYFKAVFLFRSSLLNNNVITRINKYTAHPEKYLALDFTSTLSP